MTCQRDEMCHLFGLHPPRAGALDGHVDGANSFDGGFEVRVAEEVDRVAEFHQAFCDCGDFLDVAGKVVRWCGGMV